MNRERAKLIVRGAVQGVGFRPFVYRLAAEMNLTGWVSNSAQGVFIEVEGARETLENFLLRLEKEKPSLAVIQSHEASFLDPIGYKSFEIRHSDESGNKTALMLPDIATCADCLREFLIPGTGAISIRSRTAPTAARASRSSKRCLMIAPTPR